jgi:hypothetical protein
MTAHGAAWHVSVFITGDGNKFDVPRDRQFAGQIGEKDKRAL